MAALERDSHHVHYGKLVRPASPDDAYKVSEVFPYDCILRDIVYGTDDDGNPDEWSTPSVMQVYKVLLYVESGEDHFGKTGPGYVVEPNGMPATAKRSYPFVWNVSRFVDVA